MLFITKKDKESIKILSKLQKEVKKKGNSKKLWQWEIGLAIVFASVLVFLLGIRFSGVVNTIPLICLFWITMGFVIWAFLITYLVILMKLSGRIKVDKEKDSNYKIKQTSPEFLRNKEDFSKI